MADPDISGSFVILGQTTAGKRFRPSDWAERLCGVMSQYGPAGKKGGHLTYSPFVMPGTRDGIKCISVDARLYDIEPLAWRFMVSFARDNQLIVQTDQAMAPEPAGQATAAPVQTP